MLWDISRLEINYSLFRHHLLYYEEMRFMIWLRKYIHISQLIDPLQIDAWLK